MTERAPITRRYFFFGCLAVATSCRRISPVAPTPGLKHNVSVVRAMSYSKDLTDIVKRILVDHRVAVQGKRVVLKPNLVEFSEHTPINTHPVLVASVRDAFYSLGAADVRIAEGPGHRRMTLDMASAAGYFEAISKFESGFTDLNLDDVQPVEIVRPFSTLKKLYLPETVLRCDLLVSMPKMKTHHWVGATLSMKNLFGVVPGGVYGWPKNILHWAGIPECIADLHGIFPKQFCIVDGIEGMEGNGPILGTPKRMGVIVAGAHPPSVDATCCQVMKIDPNRIGYLHLITQRTGWTNNDIRQTGESIRGVASPFALIPAFSDLRL